MDVKQLAQDTVDSFNDRTYRQKAMEVADPNVVVIDKPIHAVHFLIAKGTTVEQKVDGNKVTTRVHGIGTFTGTLYSPQGSFPGNGNPVDIEYTLEQEFNEAGKLKRFVVDYDMQDFMRQLGLM